MTAQQLETIITERPAPCPRCGAPSTILWRIPMPCAECRQAAQEQSRADDARRHAERAERERHAAKLLEVADHERRVARCIEALGVPPRYANAALDSFALHGDEISRGMQERALAFASRYVAEWPEVPVITVFTGGYGAGKGHLAWSIAKALGGRAVSARVIVLADLIRDLREAWSRGYDGPSESVQLDGYRGSDLLVIDEISRHAFYGQPQQHLYDLVAWRDVQLKPTIITTNELGDDLATVLGPALLSRAVGSGAIINFGTSDYRLTQQRWSWKGAA